MSQAKRQKIKYGDPTDYNKSVESGAIIPRTPSKTSDELKADIKKGYLVPRPGQADTHLSHLNFSHEAILNAAALDSQEKIARRYYEANIDMINATRKSAGLAELTVDQAVAAAKAVYDVLNDKGKESDELKKDIEAGVIIYRRLNKDLEEEVLAKDVIGPGGSLSITTTVTSTTTIGTSPAAGSEHSGRVRRSTTEEAPAPETSGSTETTQNGGTPNKKNKGDQSSETVATELPHVAPDHGTTETGNAGEGARPSSGRGTGGSSVSPSQPEEKGGTEAPAPVQPPVITPEAPVVPAPENNNPAVTPEAPKPKLGENIQPQPETPVIPTPTVPETSTNPEPPVESSPVQPPSQPEDSVVTPAPETNPAQPESSVENTPTPEPPHVETEEEKLAKYTEDDFSGSTASWYNFEHPEIFYNALPADSNMHLERGKTYRLVMLNTTTNKAEYVEVKHPKDIFTKHIHANNTDYGLRPSDAPVEGEPYKDIVVYDWGNLNELADDVELQECSGMYYTTNESLVPVFDYTKGLKWYDFDDVSKVYEIDDSNEHSALTSEFNLDVRLTGETEVRVLNMPVFNDVFTKEVEYDGKTYLIRPQDNYTDEAHVRDIVMVEKSKLPNAAHVTIKTFNDAHLVVSNRVLHVETDEEKLAKYHQEDFSSSIVWYNLDNVHTIYMIHNDDVSKVIERGKTYKLVMWNSEADKAEFVEFKHIADVFTETVHANEIDYCVRPQDVYVEGAEDKDIIVYEKASYDTMPDQTLETMVGIVYQSNTANLAPTVYEYNSQLKWYDLNDTSHVYLVPDTYAYNNLLENLEITVKDTATDSETKMTIPNPSTVFTKDVEYDGKTYVMRPEDEYTEGGVEKNIVIIEKSMTTGFAVYMQSVLGGIKIVSNKSLVKTESSSTEDPVVNGKKLSEYTEAEFDSATIYFDLEAPADVNGTLYTLRADADKPFDLNTAYDLVMMEATSKKVKLVHIDPILTTFTHEVKTQSELDIMLRPQDAYVNGVTRDVVYIDKAVKDEARTVATFMHYVSTDSMTNLKPYEASSTTETNPAPETGGSTENSNDPVIQGKKLSEYTSDEFYKSSSIKIPEEPDDDFLIRNADFNLEISTNGIIEIAVQGRTMYGIKATTVADPKTVFTKKVLYGSEEYYIRPEDAYDGHNSKSIVIVPKEFLDICPTTLQNYMNQSGTVYSVSNTDVTDPDVHSTEEANSDPVINGKKVSEYTSDDFDQSYNLIVPEDPSEEYLVLESELDTVFAPGESKEILGMPKYSGNKAKMLTVKDPRAVYTKKMNAGVASVFIRPEDIYDGHTNKSIAYLSSTHHLGTENITLRDILSGDISTMNNNSLTDPDAPAPEAPKTNEIDYSGPNLFKQVNGDYVFLDGSEINYGGEHDNLGNLDDPYDMSKEYNIATPYNGIPMEKLVNKNIIVYGPSGEKEIFMFPDLQYMFDTEVKDNWNTTYLIRSQDLYTNSSESKPIFAIDKSSLGERPLYSLTPHELLYNGPLVTRQNDEFHQ